MKLADLSQEDYRDVLQGPGLYCRIGPFDLRLRGHHEIFADTFRFFYANAELLQLAEPGTSVFEDFRIEMSRPRGLRRYLRPQVKFTTDSETPFEPFPLDHSFPHFEWGLNWLIASRAHHYLMLHAAVLARGDKALVLPASPGSGKSTLCAALMLRGWRLLSDEFGLLRPESGLLEPIPRPIPLKNESIEVIRAFSPQSAVLGPTYSRTRKGDVAHVRPQVNESVAGDHAAKPAWVVFPRYLAGVADGLYPFAPGRSFLQLSGNAFNYRLLGAAAFSAVVKMVETCPRYYLEFSDLEHAVALIEEMVAA